MVIEPSSPQPPSSCISLARTCWKNTRQHRQWQDMLDAQLASFHRLQHEWQLEDLWTLLVCKILPVDTKHVILEKVYRAAYFACIEVVRGQPAPHPHPGACRSAPRDKHYAGACTTTSNWSIHPQSCIQVTIFGAKINFITDVQHTLLCTLLCKQPTNMFYTMYNTIQHLSYCCICCNINKGVTIGPHKTPRLLVCMCSTPAAIPGWGELEHAWVL